jgi:predicted deacylase
VRGNESFNSAAEFPMLSTHSIKLRSTMKEAVVEHIDSLTSASFNLRLRAACERHGAHLEVAANGSLIMQIGRADAVRLAMMSGLHGDERSGPIALLRWLEETATGALVPEGVSLWLAPLVNDDGWDLIRREWKGIDLNRSFLDLVAPEFLREIMNSLRSAPPFLFIDLHEDSDVSYAYVYRNVDDRHDLAARLQAHLNASDVPWKSDEPWDGASEIYVRGLGTSLCTTLEAPPVWSLTERVEWHTKAIQWCADHILSYAGASGVGEVRRK